MKPIPKSSKNKDSSQDPMGEKQHNWPERPDVFSELMTPVEAAMFLRLDQIGHTPKSAKRTLDYWRNHDELKATKYAKHVWYLKKELEKFLVNKTEERV